MRTGPSVLAAAILTALLLAGSPTAASDPKGAARGDLDQAEAFVKNLQLNENFGGMIVRTALLTPTIKTLAEKHGEITVYHALRQFTLVAVSTHGDAWTENLAKAYAAHFTNAEMVSIMAERAKSPHLDKIKTRGAEVGDTMRDLSFDLLGKVTSEVVTKTVNEFSRPNR